MRRVCKKRGLVLLETSAISMYVYCHVQGYSLLEFITPEEKQTKEVKSTEKRSLAKEQKSKEEKGTKKIAIEEENAISRTKTDELPC